MREHVSHSLARGRSFAGPISIPNDRRMAAATSERDLGTHAIRLPILERRGRDTSRDCSMNPAAVFATHFARLLSQRVREPENLEAHRATLDELLAANAHPATLVWDNW